MKLTINEIFYSLQGEGARAGAPSIFIRLTGCSAKNACFKSGVVCDTEFESGKEWEVEDLHKYLLENYNCRYIVWSGGEPTDQLTGEVIQYFKPRFRQAIECSGIRQPPHDWGLDWVVLSPKIAEHVILKKWKEKNNRHCDELRWVRKEGQEIPPTKIKAKEYFISPHFDGEIQNDENLMWCIQLCLENPEWNLSVQQHKLRKVR